MLGKRLLKEVVHIGMGALLTMLINLERNLTVEWREVDDAKCARLRYGLFACRVVFILVHDLVKVEKIIGTI